MEDAICTSLSTAFSFRACSAHVELQSSLFKKCVHLPLFKLGFAPSGGSAELFDVYCSTRKVHCEVPVM